MQASPPLIDRWLSNRMIVCLTGVVIALVALLRFLPPSMAARIDVHALPTLNASLNALSTVLLIVAFVAIKMRKFTLHRNVMLMAFATSVVFLLIYTVYHLLSPGPKLYEGDFKGLYLIVLFSHIVLAALILPLALLTLRHGLADRRDNHKRIARYTLPLWLYVSITGVVIYGMLYL